MAMSTRQLQRNIGRIPRLLFHIKRCKGQDERVAGFKHELARRELEMQLAGMEQEGSVTQAILAECKMDHMGLLKTLLAVKLTPQKDKASEGLDALYMTVFPDAETILKPVSVPVK